MTKAETEQLLKYMICLYPNQKMDDQRFNSTVQIWCMEFQTIPCELVGSALNLARLESPDWMPSIPKIQQAIRQIESRIKTKSKEQEFKDSHCGKSEQEWESMNVWKSTSDGINKIKTYKQQFLKLIDG